MYECLQADDGHGFDCWFAGPQHNVWGGVVLLPEIFGVNAQLRGVAARYAADGLRVAVPALFDRVRRRASVPFDQPAEGRALAAAITPEAALSDVGATVAALRSEGLRVAVVGFCWGGGLAVRAAQGAGIACAVSFYGTSLDSLPALPLMVPVLGHFGTADEHVPSDLLAQVRSAMPTLEMQMYPAGHAFANEMRASHNPVAANLAHARTLGFLRAHL